MFPTLMAPFLDTSKCGINSCGQWATVPILTYTPLIFCEIDFDGFLMGNAGTGTPLWRNGPPDKPVLCNACGSRWRTKGSLANYTPMHRKDDIDDDEPRVSKLKPPTSKFKSQKKKASHVIMENVLFSGQNFRKMGDADTSNRSSLGSAISYSESCAPYGDVDASEMSGQSSQCLLCCCLTK